MGKLISKGGDGQNLPYIPDNTLAQLTVKELNKKVMILMMMLITMMVMMIVTWIQTHLPREITPVMQSTTDR